MQDSPQFQKQVWKNYTFSEEGACGSFQLLGPGGQEKNTVLPWSWSSKELKDTPQWAHWSVQNEK